MGALEIPDNCSKQDYRRLYKEIALLLHPCLVQIEHDGIGALVSIRNVLHEIRMNGIATVAPARVVEVDYIEFRLDLIAVQMVEQVVIGDGGQVRKLEIVDIHRVPLFNLLFDIGVYHGV